MSRIVVVTLPERGHYHPLLGPAAALERRGHDVLFASTLDFATELRAAGVTKVLVPPGAPPPSAHVRGAALAEILASPTRLAAWIRTLLVDAPRAGVAPLRALLRDARPDVVAIDTMSYDGAIAAQLEGIPWVGWATSLNPVVPDAFDSDLIRTLRALDAERRATFREHGLDARFRVSDVLSPLGTAVFAGPCLVTPSLAPSDVDPTVHLVGPSLGGQRGGRRVDPAFAAGRPILYVSFGSQAWHQPARFARLFGASARTGWAVVAATGDLDLEVPSHVRCVGFADQHDALRHARATVTHGGAGSVMEACAYGVPMLVAPICNDQPHSAAFVVRAGNGRAIDLERCSDAVLDDALDALARDETIRARCAAIRAGYGERSGEEGAADLVERACP